MNTRTNWFIIQASWILLSFFLYIPSEAQDTKENPYHLTLVSSVNEYSGMVAKDSLQKLVDLKKTIPGIQLDIRYATSNNFTHKKIYSEPMAFLREPAARALKGVQGELKKKGIGLKIYDAYRPYAATLLFWEIAKDTLFVAAPWQGSRHNRGCAVDLGLIDLKTGKDLEMPTPFDDFTKKASPQYTDLPQKAIENRTLLIQIMNKYGFTVFPSEWWHFDFKGWERYPLMDVSFEELKGK
ncbi:MAG: M15 family metallopeptidase [Bacteroidales bacterium]|nr:M15 family metallopeptidase [Bacteroidales bacterium]MDD4603008.1 M15 family metallopeptidase [Bacteroidales bacterium]